MDVSARTLRLLDLLQGNRHWSGEDLAGRLGVSVRTLRRDVDRLRELGYPVEAARGVDGGYQLAPGAVLPPLVLTDEEAVSLAAALQRAAGEGIGGTAEAAVRVLAKVVQVMPNRLRRQVETLLAATDRPSWRFAAPAIDPDVLAVLSRACRDAERLRFEYRTIDGTTSAREVEPVRLVALSRRWYLVAYDIDRLDWRTFRLDRLSAPVPTGARFRPREIPGGDAVAHVQRGIREVQQTVSADVLVHADADDVRAAVGRWATVTAHGPGRARLQMEAESLDWVCFALGVIGAEFEVLGPPELAALLGEWGTRFARCAQT